MAQATIEPARRGADFGGDSELAAAVIRLDGKRTLWRDRRLQDDPDVTAWALGALDGVQRDYASLLWGELLAIRAAASV